MNKSIYLQAEITTPITLTWKQHLFAGGLSRGMAVTTMFPIDVVKTRVNDTPRLVSDHCPKQVGGEQTVSARRVLQSPYISSLA